MSLENITSKIIADAEETRDALLADAKKQAEEIIAEAEKQSGEIIAKAQEKGKSDRDKLIERRKSVAVLDGKKVFLQKKQELIKECFDNAVNNILSMKQEDYVNLLAGKIKATGITEGELIFNAEDIKTAGPMIMEKLKDMVPGNKFELSKETRGIRGGFLLKQSQSYINGSVEAMVEEVRDQLTGEIAAVLFE